MMEGKSVREGWVELKEKFWPTFKVSSKLSKTMVVWAWPNICPRLCWEKKCGDQCASKASLLSRKGLGSLDAQHQLAMLLM